MSDAIDFLDGVVSGLIFGGEPVQRMGSIYFILIFLLVFSIMFAATAFIPMFKAKEEYRNIRVLISLSIAFISSISFYTILVTQLQWIGLIVGVAFGISIGMLAVLPKKMREEHASKIIIVAIILALIIVILVWQGTDWLSSFWQWLSNVWSNALSSGSIWGFVIGAFVLAFIIVIIRGVGQARQT